MPRFGTVLQRKMTVHGKHPGQYVPLGHTETDSSRLFTQRSIFLLVLMMVFFPFVLARLYASHVTILQSSQIVNSYYNSSEDVQRPGSEANRPTSLQLTHKLESPQNKKVDSLELTKEHVDPKGIIDFTVGGCDIWRGQWIPDSSDPPYTNVSCPFIQGHQNCLKNGRPDLTFLHWKWRPNDCELPQFNAKEFLWLVKGKAWAFVGDSIARNHFQSFLCHLAQIEMPENLYRDERDLFVQWYFPSYNFTLAVFWSPFLVKWTEDEIQGLPPGTEKLYLDTVDPKWAVFLPKFDYIVLSSGHWYLKSSVYYQNNEVIGCHYCPGTNITQLGFYFGFRTALRTVFDYLMSSKYKGIMFFRTFTPDHFEGGQWHNGGHCVRTMPSHNATVEGVIAEMHKIQLEEFGLTLQQNPGVSARLKIADTIHASIVRPDGHPGPYRDANSLQQTGGTTKPPQDCLHWCLPGAIDTWSAMILHMLKQL